MKATAISIPASYTTFIAPVTSSKVYGDISKSNDFNHLESPYVVKLRNIFEIAPPKSIWTFQHPTQLELSNQVNSNFNHHNTRYTKNDFNVAQDCIIHGIAGYFECVLYKDITISTNPATHSPGMFSWFPIFFPIKSPMFLARNSSIGVSFWRLSDTRKVWYEWSVVSSVQGVELLGDACGIHNPGGVSSWIGL